MLSCNPETWIGRIHPTPRLRVCIHPHAFFSLPVLQRSGCKSRYEIGFCSFCRTDQCWFVCQLGTYDLLRQMGEKNKGFGAPIGPNNTKSESRTTTDRIPHTCTKTCSAAAGNSQPMCYSRQQSSLAITKAVKESSANVFTTLTNNQGLKFRPLHGKLVTGRQVLKRLVNEGTCSLEHMCPLKSWCSPVKPSEGISQ